MKIKITERCMSCKKVISRKRYYCFDCFKAVEEASILASKVFLSNPSAYNYNFLLTAMLTYQYWQAKRTKCFTLEAEF